MKNKVQLLFKDSSSSIETWLSPIEDAIISNLSNTPADKCDNLHVKWDIQVPPDSDEILMNIRLRKKSRANVAPTCQCTCTAKKQMIS